MEISYYKSVTCFTKVKILTGEGEQEFLDKLNEGIYEVWEEKSTIIIGDTGEVVGELQTFQSSGDEQTDFEIMN
jgi:hypothetical protein